MENQITALIPTYRRPQFLKRAIESVLSQTYQNVKISIFDDHSGDETCEIISMFNATGKINYYCHAQTLGPIKNTKFAYASVNTPYFSHFCDDDFIANDFYENAINILDKYPNVMFVIMNLVSVDREGNLLSKEINTDKLTFYIDKTRFDDYFSNASLTSAPTAIVFRKKVAEIYTEMNDQYDIGPDVRFLLRAIARYPFAHLSRTGAYFTCHDASFSSSKKYYDYMHHIVQLNRFVEIYHDAEVDPYIKKRVISYARQLNKKSSGIYVFWPGIKRALKNICYSENAQNMIGINDIEDAKVAGYNYLSIVLTRIYKSKLIRLLTKHVILPLRKLQYRKPFFIKGGT